MFPAVSPDSLTVPGGRVLPKYELWSQNEYFWYDALRKGGDAFIGYHALEYGDAAHPVASGGGLDPRLDHVELGGGKCGVVRARGHIPARRPRYR